ncbi:MAG TPA: cbb3-type cytochrome c oxidase N-terminal domain-containing protein [Gemmatimonadaceae bacterium]
MADTEKDRLLDHSYDGIQEYDNPMPRWWVITFWATIIFSVLYLLDVPGIGMGEGRIAEYNADMAKASALRAEAGMSGGGVTPEALASLVSDQRVLAEGKQVFATYCAACHRADGGGQIGPNLTDDAWIHGAGLIEIRTTISDGVLAKGMPAWGKVLKPDQVTAATIYVKSLGGTNPPDPKAPEGVKIP